MKISGFTFIRNAIKYDYPIVEAIQSLLPICDEMIVSIGDSEDETGHLIKSIHSPKIRIVQSVWNESLKSGGQVLADETNKAFDQVSADTDWCIYLQGDEVLHEQYYGTVRDAMSQYLHQPEVEGLLFNYLHFYGSYNYTADSRQWYDREIRIIRNDKTIRSFADAQGFRKSGKKLRVKPVAAWIYHYGWVKPPQVQIKKIHDFHQFWTPDDEEFVRRLANHEAGFDYTQIDSLKIFEGSHPAVMQRRMKNHNWRISVDVDRKNFAPSDRILYWLEKQTGKRLFGYRNYKLI